jgi:hypothetical protein
MAPNPARWLTELDELETELQQWSMPSPLGFELWRQKLVTLIGEIRNPNDSLAIRFSGLQWTSSASATRRRLDHADAQRMWSAGDIERFRQAQDSARQIIASLRWDLGRRAPGTDPFTESSIDPELWEHVRGLVEAGDWEKVSREAAVFVEDKLRMCAAVPPSVTGSVNVFKAAVGSSGFLLPKSGPPSEQDGWRLLATGFALALRNPSGHQIRNRPDAKRYALGVLGTASLLLTEIRHEYRDPPKP